METSVNTHSPFLPLLLLVLCLWVWMAYHVYALYEERHGAEERIHQLLPQANAALAAKKKLLSLAQAVEQLSPKDPAAAQIANEFKIHAQNTPKSDVPTQPK